MYVLYHCSLVPWGGHSTSTAELALESRPPSSMENHIPASLLGPFFCEIGRSDLSLPFCVFVCVSGGGCLETAFLKHTCWLLADTAGRLAGREAIVFIPWSGSFRPPQSTVSQQVWWLPRWQEWESVPLAVSSCLSVSTGMWAWTRFVAAFWSLGSPLCSFPLVSTALVANFLWQIPLLELS